MKFSLAATEYVQPALGATKTNLVIGAVGLLVLLWIAFLWARRLALSARLGQSWKHRRRRLSMLVMAELGVQIINLAFFIIPNAAFIATPCSRAFRWLIGATAGVRWTCWNTLFMLICIHAHNVNTWQPTESESKPPAGLKTESSAKRTETLVLDGPWMLHWTKLILWFVTFAVIIAAVTTTIKIDWVQTTDSCGDGGWQCKPTASIQAVFGLIIALAGAWFVLWLFLIYRGKWHLYGLPYADHKVANLFLRLQERSRWIFIVFFSLSLALLWYVRSDACASSIFSWLGLLPMQILATLNIGSWAYMMMPISADQETPVLQMRLQQFAWTRIQHEQVQRQREKGGHQEAPSGKPPPLFCMERAFAGLYWSGLVYDSHEAEQWQAKMAWGYELLGLEAHELIWEHRLDTKALLGWGPGGITVGFRGTASWRNALSDLQAWRIPHPPLRVPILITGHSLGGALGVLAAYDLAQAAAKQGLNVRLACYTYGAPRVGNHSFAADHEQVVPDSWSIVNDQDIVARRGKLWILYKRSGHRVIVNTRGDLIVRPSFAEANVQRIPGGGSIQQHYLASYQQALLAVCLAQFSAKRYQEGMQGVLALSLAARPLAVLFQQDFGLSSEDMAELARASESTPEKWRVRRKQMRTCSGAAETWRDAAAASLI
ncbi:hypothetical protein WJX84_001923 [Apatococcus fuscideae]|uniref:Fungal lipase-type domain-containing protein n=1 Tax=Apatococcus fuscideae TaxID=2026836 RepID=A0AAW1TDK0_9CHLO